MIPPIETSDPSFDSEWLVFACSRCAHPLKIRAGQPEGLFRCPSCEHEQAAPQATEKGGAFLPGLPAAKDPVFEANLAVDRLSNVQFRRLDDPALAIPEEGIRVRKRKRRPNQALIDANAPEWETGPGAEPKSPPPGAEGSWEEVRSTTLKQEVLEDGSVVEHRKRTLRKRLPPAVQKAWALLTRAGSVSLVVLGLFVLLGSAVAGWYLARSQTPVVAQVVEVEEFPEPYFPTMDEGTAAAELVKEFLLADSVEGKLPMVRFPEKVKPLMELWYKGRPDSPIKATRDELSETMLTKFLHIDGTKFIVVTLLTEPDLEYKMFAVESNEVDGLKVDWETAVGWQAMTVDEFIKGKPTIPQPFRVQAEPGDYYNGQYADDRKWCAVDLTYPGNPDFHLFGYVERNTPHGDRLMELIGYKETRDEEGKQKWYLLNGSSTALVLGIAYLAEGSDPKQVTIHEILHEQWFLKDGPVIGSARKPATGR